MSTTAQNLTLLTDLYELTMMQGYFKEKDANETVIFDAFYRSNPCNNGYSICAGLEQVIERAEMNVKNIPLRQVITSFAGLRAHEDGHEFLIGEVEDAKGFIDCAGIESPGLTSAPAIGEMVAQILKKKILSQQERVFWIRIHSARKKEWN